MRCHEVARFQQLTNKGCKALLLTVASKHSGASELCDLGTETSRYIKNKAATCEWSQLESWSAGSCFKDDRNFCQSSIDLFENGLLSFRRTKWGTLEHLQLHTFKFCINPGLCSHAQMAAHMYQEPLLQTVYKTIQQFNSLQTKAQQTLKKKNWNRKVRVRQKEPFVFSAWQRQAQT